MSGLGGLEGGVGLACGGVAPEPSFPTIPGGVAGTVGGLTPAQFSAVQQMLAAGYDPRIVQAILQQQGALT
jgi:hypothetical protein